MSGPSSFSDLIDVLIDSRDLNQSDIGRVARVDPSRVSEWRRGLGVPSPRTLERLAAFFGLDYDQLMVLCGHREAAPAAITDPDETEWLALYRQLPTEHRPTVKQMVRGLAVQPTERRAKGRVDGTRKSLEERRRELLTGVENTHEDESKRRKRLVTKSSGSRERWVDGLLGIFGLNRDSRHLAPAT